MAFTFDCTLKGTDSNSYVCVADADDYFDGDPRQSEWTALTTTQKEQYLVRATNRLEYEQYGGTPTDSTVQRLQWPRKWVIHRNQQDYEYTVVYPEGDYYYDFQAIPKQMEVATFEQAMWYIEEYNETPTVSRSDQDRISKYGVGPMAYDIRKSKEAALNDEVQRALRSLGPNGWLGGQYMRLVR